ncbi:ATP-binding protein [Pedobacter sp. SG908]|uniref:PAS domain-containing sensor histidine kinase n=1 Tax=Pedobacter sp. SG908 TaxID=2587135 RepID=UPI00141E1B74|nr:ATP-binding protein [Pedobacter sp. SG908]NII81309.1 PAS domain S-box-containing protein [Pedobacter sp. SG908]
MQKTNEHISLERAYEELRIQLEEANDIIHAIRSGEVDALIVDGENGRQLFTLKSADHTYRIFIEQMSQSALTLDASARILYCNSQLAKLLSLPLEKVIGSNFLTFFSKEDQAIIREIIAVAWEKDSRTEINIISSAGIPLPVQLSLKVLNLDEGTALSIIITDLSELKKNQLLLETRNKELEATRKTADELNENLENIVRQRTRELEATNEELAAVNDLQTEINNQLNNALHALKESEDNLQSAFDAAELGSCNLDIKTGRVEASKRFRELCGLPLEEEVNWKMVMECVDAEHLSDFEQVFKDCINLRKPLDYTYLIRNLVSSEHRWVRIVGKAKRSSGADFDSIYAVLMDVTDQKRDEQRKNDFIAMVSHELKTPLTSMKGYIQVMQLKAKSNQNDFADKALQRAERQVNKMTSMINGFLNLSRLESGKMLMDFQPIEMSLLLEEVVEEYIATVNSHDIKFAFQPGLFVNVDKDKVGHVINNLVSNAMKYSPVDSEITVECYPEGETAVFRIADHGMGIDENDIPKLFERFYRVESNRMTTVAGFGIGLYLSAEIIQRHGGKIWAESEIGKGSVFYFSLPLLNPS